MTDMTRVIETTISWQKRPKRVRWPRIVLPKGFPWPRQQLVAVGLTITIGWVVLALCGPWLVPYDPLQGEASLAAAPPSLAHPFGMDKYGREMLSEKLKEYAQAARAIGCSDTRLIFRHLLPNALGPIVTQSTMNLSWAIL